MKFKIYDSRLLYPENKFAGYNGENLAEKLEFELEEYKDYDKTICFKTEDGTMFDILEDNQYVLKNNLTKYDEVTFYLQFSKMQSNEMQIIKTSEYLLKFKNSFDIKEENLDIDTNITVKIFELEERIKKIEESEITQGKDGRGILNIEKTATNGLIDTYTITFTDNTTTEINIKNGDQGLQGETGSSAYEIAVKYGFNGTEEEWLASLKGEPGIKGEKGIQGEQGIKGEKGDKGDAGEQGLQGIQGPAGINGQDGYTPIKGTDYYTEEEKQELITTLETYCNNLFNETVENAIGGEY